MSAAIQPREEEVPSILNSASRINVHDLTLIREALLSVIDDGDPKPRDPKLRKDWLLYSVNETIANDARLRFCDAVQRYIVARIPGSKLKGIHRRP